MGPCKNKEINNAPFTDWQLVMEKAGLREKTVNRVVKPLIQKALRVESNSWHMKHLFNDERRLVVISGRLGFGAHVGMRLRRYSSTASVPLATMAARGVRKGFPCRLRLLNNTNTGHCDLHFMGGDGGGNKQRRKTVLTTCGAAALNVTSLPVSTPCHIDIFLSPPPPSCKTEQKENPKIFSVLQIWRLTSAKDV